MIIDEFMSITVTSPPQVRDCRLVSLLDLALEKDYVRGKVADYLNKLIDMGVAGFRVDASKHMWPGDLDNIYARLHNLNTKWFPGGSRAFMFQEVRIKIEALLKCVYYVRSTNSKLMNFLAQF